MPLWSRARAALRGVLGDTLYRGSLTLLVNTVATAAIGFVFWTLAARTYPASTLGVFSSVTSGVSLLATVAAFGLPITMIRHVADTDNQRELVVVAVIAIVTVGTTLCLFVVLAIGPLLPSALHLQQHGRMVFLITTLVALTAISGTIDAGLVAMRSSHVVLIKNLAGNVAKVAALVLMFRFRSSGLLIAYGIGLVLALALSIVALSRRLNGKKTGFRSFLMLRRYLSSTSRTYIATIMGILPLTVVPLEVLMVRGAAETGLFAVAFLIAGFLNFIPSTVAQVLFAETSRKGTPLGRQLRKAYRGVYGLLIPALAVTVVGAPTLLRVFGASYASAATGCLRILALSTLFTGGTYLVDSLLLARDRTIAYIFMNGANAALVLGGVAILLPRGLSGAAIGWALGQGASLLLGLLVLATGRVGRHHHLTSSSAVSRKIYDYPQSDLLPRPFTFACEPQIRELLDRWPLMPTTMIAEKIGWDHSIDILLDIVTELRSEYPHKYISPYSFQAGEIAQCGLWFPPTEIPVGFGQARSAPQLPVLTMITGYSRWVNAMLIPSRHANDLFSALLELLTQLGAVPQILTWDDDAAIGRLEDNRVMLTTQSAAFFHILGTTILMAKSADMHARGLIQQTHAHWEGSFLPRRSFASPADFNTQLRDWLEIENSRLPIPPNGSPAEFIAHDKAAMLPLPPAPPMSGWRLSIKPEGDPFFRFGPNAYSLPRATVGRRVELVADLKQIRALCDGKLAALHERSWAYGQTIRDPAHLATVESRQNLRRNAG